MLNYILVFVFFFYGYGDNRDIHLLTTSFPTRRSSDLKQPQLHEDLYARAEAVLKGDGIAHADLLAPLVDGKADGATFLRTDTHWTPRGAQLAAAAIAQTVRGELPAPTAPARYTTTHDAPRAHRGDLLNFLPLDPYFSWPIGRAHV